MLLQYNKRLRIEAKQHYLQFNDITPNQSGNKIHILFKGVHFVPMTNQWIIYTHHLWYAHLVCDVACSWFSCRIHSNLGIQIWVSLILQRHNRRYSVHYWIIELKWLGKVTEWDHDQSISLKMTNTDLKKYKALYKSSLAVES